MLNASERNGAEHSPLEGADVRFEELGDEVKDEEGEGKACVGHSDVEGEPDLWVPGERVIWVMFWWWRRVG